MTLVADGAFWLLGGTARFPPGLRVMVGGLACNVSWMSADGSLLHVTTPSVSRLCPPGDACGYKQLDLLPRQRRRRWLVCIVHPTAYHTASAPARPGLF